MSLPSIPDRIVKSHLIAVLLAALFVVTRLLIMASLSLKQVAFVANDVSYYGYHLYHLYEGQANVMMEYPPPAVWILQFLYLLGGGWQTWTPLYAIAFIAIDAAVAISFYRVHRWNASLFWILFTGVNGAIVWYRFDLIPAALVAWACLLLMTRPRISGALIGLGAAVKLWPALLIAPMIAPSPWRSRLARNRLIGFVLAGFGLAIATLIIHGWSRAISPIIWQKDRGLQIESVPATPLMFLRTFTDKPDWPIFLSEYNALEVAGPGVAELLRVSTALTIAAIALTGYLAYRLIRNLKLTDPRCMEATVLAINTVVLAMIVSNKTLSPQYIVWLGGPTAALLLLHHSQWLTRHLHVMAASLVVVGGLTQATYPWLTFGIMGMPNGSAPETSVLILRNLAVTALLFYSLHLTLRASRN